MSPQSKNLTYYCKKFTKLRVNRHKNRGIAPHKPILLLSILELISQKKMSQNKIYLTAELISTFQKYWSHLGSTLHNSSINLPFFHLRGDRFWHLKPKFNLDSVVRNMKSPSLKSLDEIVEYAYLDSELFQLMTNSDERSILQKILIDTWFTDKQNEVNELFDIDAFLEIQNKLKEGGGKIYSLEELDVEDKVIIRDDAFRRVLTSVYDYRCAFCGLRVIDQNGKNTVDGSHIKPFSIFYDDRISNGLSLCKNHHWAFDKGWFSVDKNYRILVKNTVEEVAPNNRAMKDFEGERMILPNRNSYYPSIECLKWHFENIFQNNDLTA